MHTIESIYRARLKSLVTEHGSQTQLAEKIGKSPSQISQWINGSKDSRTGKPRSMDRATARQIEASLGLPSGWMDQPVDDGVEIDIHYSASRQVTNDRDTASSLLDEDYHSSFTLLPVVQYQGLDMSQQNDLVAREKFEWLSAPGQFSKFAKITRMPDDSMHPEIYPGEFVAFDPEIKADPGDTVLIKDQHGGMWIRKYRPLPGSDFKAVATNGEHEPLHSREYGLQVIAVLVGHWRGRRSHKH